MRAPCSHSACEPACSGWKLGVFVDNAPDACRVLQVRLSKGGVIIVNFGLTATKSTFSATPSSSPKPSNSLSSSISRSASASLSASASKAAAIIPAIIPSPSSSKSALVVLKVR